jgi:colicin import membrane protein
MTAFALHPKRDPLRPPEAPGLGRGFAFATLVHVLLVVALSLGVHWHTESPPAFEAELWSAVPQAAAPKAEEPPPEPEPEVKPTPQPPQPSAEDLQAQRDAEIAIAKAKEQKKRQEDAAAEAKKQQALKEKQAADEKQKKLDQQKQDKLKADKAIKDADAKREALRQDNLRRMMGLAGATGAPNATGTALRSSGPSSSYGGRIKARVKPNIIYDGNPEGNPQADVEVRVAPDGTIIGRKLVKPSGDPDWDKAVLRAIDRTEVLPRDTDGSVPSLMVLTFRPRD